MRELRSVLQCALALREDDRIRAKDIQIDEPRPPRSPAASPRRRARLSDAERRQRILEALEVAETQVEAARMLGINKSTLNHHMEKLGIRPIDRI